MGSEHLCDAWGSGNARQVKGVMPGRKPGLGWKMVAAVKPDAGSRQWSEDRPSWGVVGSTPTLKVGGPGSNPGVALCIEAARQGYNVVMLIALLAFFLLALLVGLFTAAKWVLIVALVLLIASALTGWRGRSSRW